MREAVSEILDERAQVAAGLSRMVVLSLLAHGVLLSTLIFTPGLWNAELPRKENVMTISLGGAEGPNAGGMTPLSAKPVQEVAPPDARPHREPPTRAEDAGDGCAGADRETRSEDPAEADRETGGDLVA